MNAYTQRRSHSIRYMRAWPGQGVVQYHGICTTPWARLVCVCLSVGLFVCFLSVTRHLSTLRRCLRVLVAERAGAVAGGPVRRAGKHALAREHARACRTTSPQKIAALMPFKNKTVRARACCRIRNCRDFQKKGKRKPTCHFPSSVYSLPSLGVFTFRIVLDLWSEPTLVSSFRL